MATAEHRAAAPDAAPTRRPFLFAGVFLVSMAILVLQIALTRIFSFTLWYHFAYVTISVALLGYGASGAFLAVFPRLAGTSPAQRLPGYALACAAAIVIGLVAYAWVPFHPFAMMTRVVNEGVGVLRFKDIAALVIYYGAVTLPFFFAGLCISVALRAMSREVSRLYFFDLLGAGVGCLLVVTLIWLLSTPGAVAASAVIVGAAATSFALARGSRVGATAAAAVVIGVVAAVTASRLEFAPSPEKFLHTFPAETIHVFGRRWTPIFRTDAFALVEEEVTRVGSYAGWGISPAWKPRAAKEAPKIRFITHDGDAGAVVYNFDGDLAKLEMFDNLILKVPYLLLDQPDVLVIGVGGGTDIVNGVKNHARHVTGIELDPVTVEFVRVDLADFAGHLYDRPDVTMIVGEGRSTLRHSNAKFDLIQMTGVDTLAALSTGAYVLSESYLYTVEAMNEFLDHLTPNGVLSVIVADFRADRGGSGYPRHTMRQLALFTEALQRRGITDVDKHVAVMASSEAIPQVAMMMKAAPFTAEETGRLRDFATRMGFDLWALPGEKIDSVPARFLAQPSATRGASLADVPLILTPTTDDNPFFFNFYRWGNLGKNLTQIDVGHTLATGQIILAMILVLAIGFSVVLILVPLLVFQRQGLRTDGKWGFVVFFLAIGLGFMCIEISFIQKFVLFLGYPTYALTVVLFSLLTWSGVGSALTGTMRGAPEDRFAPLFVALAAISLVYLVALPRLFAAFLGSAFALRVVIATMVLAPLGLVMGMFFPSGIQIVRRANVQFVPWAWGINGCASVVATVAAVILAMSYGFRVVTVVALAIYLVGVIAIRAAARAAGSAGDMQAVVDAEFAA